MTRREAKVKTDTLRRIIRVVCKTLSVTTGECGAEIKAQNDITYTLTERDALTSLGIIPTTYGGTFVPFDAENIVPHGTTDINTLLDNLSEKCGYFKSIVEGC